jgi:hypothetical protein
MRRKSSCDASQRFVKSTTGNENKGYPPNCLNIGAAYTLTLSLFFDDICVVRLIRRAAYIPKITVLIMLTGDLKMVKKC